ncbi:MAG: SPASM domain-containing protein, partial [Pseudomonadota bacterium]
AGGGMCITPSGKVLPCHAAETITTLDFDNVRDKPLRDIWARGDAFRAYRGTDWMADPCKSCDRQTKDWGGCRCQAFAWTGDAGAVDPACSKAPNHAEMREAALAEAAQATEEFEYRMM